MNKLNSGEKVKLEGSDVQEAVSEVFDRTPSELCTEFNDNTTPVLMVDVMEDGEL
jgi:hypothetical protein